MDNERYTIGWLKEDYRKRFEWLYKTMYRQMAVFARNFLRDDDLAEDMVQEVFANLWTKGKEMRAWSRSSPLRMMRAAFSGCMRKGLGPGMAAHMGEAT